jgi:hypothetical protein
MNKRKKVAWEKHRKTRRKLELRRKQTAGASQPAARVTPAPR